MISISTRELNHYQCKTIKVDFGDEVWENAVVELAEPGQYEERILVFSTFNGIYSQCGTHEGRCECVTTIVQVK